MVGQSPLDTGAAALAAGRWAEARTAYGRALDDHESGAALEGLAEASWWLGQTVEAVRYREQAYVAYRREDEPAGAVRVGLAAAVGHAADLGNSAAARGWVTRVERLLQGDAAGLAGWVETIRGYVSDDPAEALAAAERGLQLARQRGDVDLELVALADSGSVLVALGRTLEGLARVDEAMAAALAGEGTRLDTVAFVCCDMLHACEAAGDIDRAVQWCRVADGFTARYGCPFLHTTCRASYGALLVEVGQWNLAEAELLAALESTAAAAPGVRQSVLVRLAELRVQQGRLEQAEELLRGVDHPDAALPAAALHLARSQPEAAAALLRGAPPGRLRRSPRALLLLVRAALARADLDEASRAVDELSGVARHGDRRVAAWLALARGELLEARGEVEDAVAEHARAAELLAGCESPLESARARSALARLLAVTDPSAARVEARRAVEELDALDARPDADRAAALLRRLGGTRPGRQRGRAALTAREQEVLHLLALGLTNAQIAERLVISPRTAAHHVSAVLAKLGVSNRAQAAAHAARQEVLPPP